jgi:hypothetical protein
LISGGNQGDELGVAGETNPVLPRHRRDHHPRGPVAAIDSSAMVMPAPMLFFRGDQDLRAASVWAVSSVPR